MPPTVIVDCNSICHRVRHTLGSLSHNEQAVGVIFGFLRQVQTIAKRLNSNKFIFCWDSTSRKRKEIYPNYKANRHKEWTDEEKELNEIAYSQFFTLRTIILPKIGFKNIFYAEGYESDDIIARIVKDNGHYFVIVSTDGDLFQLLRPNVSMLIANDKPLFTEESLWQKHLITPDKWSLVKSISGCFDKETDILTNKGWIKFENLTGEELVYSMDPLTRKTIYRPIKKIIKYFYKGKMYKITGNLIDLMITPNHKLIGKPIDWEQANTKPLVTKEIQNISGNFSIPIVSKWSSEKENLTMFTLPKYKNYWYMPNGGKSFVYLPEIQINIEDWVAFLGIWLAEGHVAKDPSGIREMVFISQKKGQKNDVIGELVSRLPFNWKPLKNGGFYTQSVQLGTYLYKLGKSTTKYIPEDIKMLPSNLLSILIDWMVFGDGGISKTGEITYWTASEKLANDFQEAVIKTGRSAAIFFVKERTWNIRGAKGISKPGFVIYIYSSKTLNLKHKTIEQIPYADFVYDIETEPHHTIFVRRNGKAIWSSNCSTDNVAGIKGVGEKTAIRFINNELKPTSKSYKEIKSGANRIVENMRLVKLPFEGLRSFTLKKDKLSIDGFLEVCNEYGFYSLSSKESLEIWRRIFFS